MMAKRWYNPEHFKLIGHAKANREKRMTFYALIILLFGTLLFLIYYYSRKDVSDQKKQPENQPVHKNS